MATLTTVFKLAQAAEKHWRRLNKYQLALKALAGEQFIDGELKKAA